MSNALITINGPVVDAEFFYSPSSRLIYSISLMNGMVITSPEKFAQCAKVNDGEQESLDSQPRMVTISEVSHT